MRRLPAALACASMLIYGCVSSATPRVTEGSFECAGSIDKVAKPPTELRIVADVVALPSVAQTESLPLGREESNGDLAGYRFSKFPILVRPGTQFDLFGTASGGSDVLLIWSAKPGVVPLRSISFEACEGDSEWLVYPGGVWVSEPTCVTLELVVEANEESITLGVGASCADAS